MGRNFAISSFLSLFRWGILQGSYIYCIYICKRIYVSSMRRCYTFAFTFLAIVESTGNPSLRLSNRERSSGVFFEIPTKSTLRQWQHLFIPFRRYVRSRVIGRKGSPSPYRSFPSLAAGSSRYTEHIGISSPYHLSTLPSARERSWIALVARVGRGGGWW